MTTRLFVYGTLMSGQPNNRRMQGGTLIGRGRVHGFALYDLGPFPMIVPSAGNFVQGELWEVNDEILRDCDILEGTRVGFYNRRQVTVQLADGSLPEAWVYVYGRRVEGVHVPSGDWRECVFD